MLLPVSILDDSEGSGNSNEVDPVKIGVFGGTERSVLTQIEAVCGVVAG